MAKLNFVRNVCVFLSFGSMGLVASLIGATYVHMEKLFNISSQTMSLSLTGCFSGSLLGAGICAIVYHRINPELNLAFDTAVSGLMTIGAFYAKGIIPYVLCMTLQGVFFGIVCAAAPVYLIQMWKDTKWNRPVLNCLYTFWSIGALIGPFIIRLFICHNDNSEHELVILTANSTVVATANVTEGYMHDEDEKQFSQDCLKLAKSSYLVMGCIVLFTSLPFCGVYLVDCFCLNGKTNKNVNTIALKETISDVEKNEDEIITFGLIKKKKKKKRFVDQVIICSLLLVFTTITISIECITAQYVVSFAAKHLNWSVRNASFLITLFFTAHSLSRASNILISIYCKPVIILFLNVIACILAYVLMVLFINMWPNVIYISVSIVGFAIASAYPNEVLLVSENVQFTQIMSAIAIIGFSMGGIISPFLLTSLISSFGEICFIYFQISASLLLFLVLLFQILFFNKLSS